MNLTTRQQEELVRMSLEPQPARVGAWRRVQNRLVELGLAAGRAGEDGDFWELRITSEGVEVADEILVARRKEGAEMTDEELVQRWLGEEVSPPHPDSDQADFDRWRSIRTASLLALLGEVRKDERAECLRAGEAEVVKFCKSYAAGNFIGSPTQQKEARDSMHQGAGRVLRVIRDRGKP